jgi:hypothetical protein
MSKGYTEIVFGIYRTSRLDSYFQISVVIKATTLNENSIIIYRNNEYDTELDNLSQPGLDREMVAALDSHYV